MQGGKIIRFLVVFESLPEDTFVYTADTEDEALIARIRACHHQFANATDCPADVEATISSIDTWATMIYDSTSQDQVPPVVSGRYEIIITGFML